MPPDRKRNRKQQNCGRLRPQFCWQMLAAGLLTITGLVTLPGCTAPALETHVRVSPTPNPPASPSPAPPQATAAANPVQTAEFSPDTPQPSATLLPAPTAVMCSPLQGIAISELSLPDLFKNAFQAPLPGMDDGHHGVDFAYWTRAGRNTMLGHPVLAALSGRTAGVLQDRPPYGFAVIIETPLDTLPAGWLAAMPAPAPTSAPAPSLYCPPGTGSQTGGPARSLYLLYAHLNQLPLLVVDQAVGCGEEIGEVGTTGKSVNPHLHLETRIGPSGVTFEEMAHYDNAATLEEMASYCAWRVSGQFQMFDPFLLFSLQP